MDLILRSFFNVEIMQAALPYLLQGLLMTLHGGLADDGSGDGRAAFGRRSEVAGADPRRRDRAELSHAPRTSIPSPALAGGSTPRASDAEGW